MRMARGDARSTEQGTSPTLKELGLCKISAARPTGGPGGETFPTVLLIVTFLQQRSLHNSGDTVALADDGYQGRTAEKAWISNQDSYVPSNLELLKRGSQQSFRHQVSGWLFQPPCFQYLGALGMPASWSR